MLEYDDIKSHINLPDIYVLNMQNNPFVLPTKPKHKNYTIITHQKFAIFSLAINRSFSPCANLLISTPIVVNVSTKRSLSSTISAVSKRYQILYLQAFFYLN